jgi:hypothetical protein
MNMAKGTSHRYRLRRFLFLYHFTLSLATISLMIGLVSPPPAMLTVVVAVGGGRSRGRSLKTRILQSRPQSRLYQNRTRWSRSPRHKRRGRMSPQLARRKNRGGEFLSRYSPQAWRDVREYQAKGCIRAAGAIGMAAAGCLRPIKKSWAAGFVPEGYIPPDKCGQARQARWHASTLDQ